MKKIKQKLKIIFITPYFPPDTGGAQNYAYNIALGLSKKIGWNVVVVTTNFRSNKIQTKVKDGLKVYYLPKFFSLSNTPINPLWYFQIKKIIKKERPDLINAHSPVVFMADIAAMVSGNIPFVLTYHAGTMKKNKFLFDIIINLYETLILPNLLNRANKIICSSEFVKKTMMKNYKFKTTVITPGVDIKLFKPNAKVKKDQNTILFICKYANMYRMKGLYYLIDSIKQMPNIKLRIIGQQLTSSLEHISFIGAKAGESLVKEIQKAGILILPSLAHMESFGMVIIEAMACKTPVIGANIGGIPEVIVNNKDGLLVPSKDSIALRNAIEKIVNNKELAKSMGELGYQKVRNEFMWDKKISETQKIITNLLA